MNTSFQIFQQFPGVGSEVTKHMVQSGYISVCVRGARCRVITLWDRSVSARDQHHIQ